MRIAIVAPSAVPFAIGGAERLWDGLLEHLNGDTPHDAGLITLPSREHNLPDLMASYKAFSDLDLSHFDLVISGKYPAWMVRHPRHVVYMLHPLRGLYDQYPEHAPTHHQGAAAIRPLTSYLRSASPAQASSPAEVFALFDLVSDSAPGSIDFAFPGPLARELVHWLDAFALDPARIVRHAAISATVARRPDYFPAGSAAEVVIPPSGLAGLREGKAEYLFTASRLDRPKRIDLVIDAMRHVPSNHHIKIAGGGPDEARLRERASQDPRIEFVGRVTDEQLADLYADSLAVLFVPADEDLGLVTFEAQQCAKPVITCSDSGGPTELVVDGTSGLVVAPDPEAIAEAINRLVAEPHVAERMGRYGKMSAAAINWSTVADVLLAPVPLGEVGRSSGTSRPRIVVLSTFPIMPPLGGGALRCLHLSEGLSRVADVTVVCFDAGEGVPSNRGISPGLTQQVVPRSIEHHQLEAALARDVSIPITDIVATALFDRTPAFDEAVRRALETADGVILEHPYLLRAALRHGAGLPIIYDAQNAEYVMKSDMLDENDAGDRLRRLTREVEQQAVRAASLVVTCTETDAALLRELGPTLADWAVVGNGTDLAGTPFTGPTERAERRARWLSAFREAGGPDVDHMALFIGSYHPPNATAAEAIVRFAGQLPDVLFVLAGSHTRHFARWKLPANVLLLDHISDGQRLELLAMASVALNPVTVGGGSNLKLAEYFAAGIPAVSTAVGARGSGARDGVELVIAGVDEMPAAIRRVLDDQGAAESRTSAARTLAETVFDWRVLGTRYAELVVNAVERGGPGSGGSTFTTA